MSTTAWVLILYSSLSTEVAVSGIATKADCENLFLKIRAPHTRHITPPTASDARCFEYKTTAPTK